MSLKYSFENKRVLITGGGRGLGRTLVKRFSEEGAIVHVLEINQDFIQILKSEFPKINIVCIDLSDWDKTKMAVESLGPMDHLINCAVSPITHGSFFEITQETLKKAFDVNLFAMVNVTQIVAKNMIANNIFGTIVNMASIIGMVACDQVTEYCCSKSAIIMLTKCAALEFAPKNIRVNCVSPGLIGPSLRNFKDDHLDNYMKRNATKKLSSPDQVSNLIFYLLSPLSEMITGQNSVIDGGHLIN